MASAEGTACVLCGKGHVSRQTRDVAFRQWSDKVTFIAALRSRLMSAITAIRPIPWTQESTSYLRMRSSANMTNDESYVGLMLRSEPQARERALGAAPQDEDPVRGPH